MESNALCGTFVLIIVGLVAVLGLVINSSGLTGAWTTSWRPPTMSMCTDSDGKSIDPLRLNYVTLANTRYYDTCSGDTLQEAVCAGTTRVSRLNYNCATNGMRCQNGVCAQIAAAITMPPIIGPVPTPTPPPNQTG